MDVLERKYCGTLRGSESRITSSAGRRIAWNVYLDQCHYVRASVLQRVGTYECVHLCVYVSVSICSYSAMYLLCVCAYHFSAFQTIHFPALEVIRRSKRTPDPQWQLFLRCFPHLCCLQLAVA